MTFSFSKLKSQQRAYLYTCLVVVLWSTVAAAFKICLNSMSCWQMLLYASLVSSSVLYMILVWQSKLSLLANTTRQEYFRSALMGFINPFLFYILLFKAYQLLPAQQAQPLNYTWPIMMVLLSVPLLHQPIKLRSLLAIIISFLGVVVISTRGEPLQFSTNQTSGIVLALVSAITWAFYWILDLRDNRDQTVKLFLNFSFGLIYILIANIIFASQTLPTLSSALAVIYIGLFEMGITFFIWSKALRLSTNTAQISNYIFLVPFLSLFWIYLLVGEKILLTTVIGLVLIITGILLQTRSIKTVRC